MATSPETPKPKMAQGKKAGPPPEETIQEKINKFIRESKKIQAKKLEKMRERGNRED